MGGTEAERGEGHAGTAPCAIPPRPEALPIIRPLAAGETAGCCLDGELIDVAEIAGPTPRVKQTRGYVIGSRRPINGGFFGRNDLYELLLYDRVLSLAELRSLHNYLGAPPPLND